MMVAPTFFSLGRGGSCCHERIFEIIKLKQEKHTGYVCYLLKHPTI